MRTTPWTLIALCLCLVGGTLRADDPPPPSSQPAQPQPGEDHNGDAEHKEPFVDRDGDGIQDGKEHRFRKRRGKGRGHGPDGEQRRIRWREGPGDPGGEPGQGPGR